MRHKHLIFLLLFFVIAVTLSACAGGVTTATSWPGLTVDDKYAYVAYNTQVYAVDLVNGTERWRYPAEPDNNVTFYADPTLSEDGQLVVGSYDYNLYSLNAESGAQNWVFPDAENRYIASSLIAAENIFSPAADENLYSLDLNGRLQWTFSSEGEAWAKPIPGDNCDCLYLPTMDHSVYAVDAQSGTQIWRSPQLGGAVVGTPAYGEDGTLYVGTFGGKLIKLSSEDGSILGEYTTADDGWIWSGPTISDGVLYFGDLNGYFYAVDANDLSELWKLPPEQLDGEIVGSPLIIEDSIYITTEAGILFKLDTTGKIAWSQTIGDGAKIYTSPRSANDLILVAPIEVDELLVAFNQDGVRQWAFTPAE